MGWTGVYKNYNAKDNRKRIEAYLKDSVFCHFENTTVVDFEVVSNPVPNFFDEAEVYAAFKSHKTGEVYGSVILVSCHQAGPYAKKTTDQQWLCKIMDEEGGPFYYKCPQRILDQLDPPKSDWAANWRNKCGDTRHWETAFEEDNSPSM